MSGPFRRILSVLAAAAAGCSSAPASHVDPRLADDVGGWTPASVLVDDAFALGDRPDRAAAIAALDGMPPARRVDVLRAGIRLRDRSAAIACAARLTYRQMDRWECARAVDLLTPEVFRPGTEADFDEFRSYLGSVELARVLRSLPTPPWDTETALTFAEFHRVVRAEHLPIYSEIAWGPDPVLAAVAKSDLGFMCRWHDEHREAIAGAFLGVDPASLPPPREGQGLPPALTASLADLRTGGRLPPEAQLPWLLRWCHDERPGPEDEALLIDLAERCGDGEEALGGTARMMLGQLGGPTSEAWLRRDWKENGSRTSMLALARRGDPEALERTLERLGQGDPVEAPVRTPEDPGHDDLFPLHRRRPGRQDGGQPLFLAVAMERAPERAAAFLEAALLGPDERYALRGLVALREFAAPGAKTDVFGIDWRRTSFDGLAAETHASAACGRLGGLRAAVFGVTIPQCRTRPLAEVAAREFSLRWLDEDAFGTLRLPGDDIVAFLETGAPDAFRETLRRIAADVGAQSAADGSELRPGDRCGVDRRRARELLAVVGDPEPGESLRDHVRGQLARGDRAWEGLGSRVLAKRHRLPGEVARDLVEDPGVPGVEEAIRAGRPIDALALVLAANPDDPVYDVGLVDDPRVRAYLARLRERRDLGLHWYATGELAVLGDPAARAEFWGAMQDGRHRVTDEFGIVPRTLGLDLAATMPFWIDELRSQCCRVSNGLQGDIVDDILGIEGHDTSRRTPYERAKELWDSAGGRFVWSRHLERFVPEPR